MNDGLPNMASVAPAGRAGARGAGGVWRRGTARAFTLIEMLVVMIIIVVIVSVSLPAFSSMLYSQEEAGAEAQLSGAVTQARDAAIRNGPGEDAAAVFTFEPGGRLTMITCVRVGVLSDPSGGGGLGFPDRYEVFAPLANATPVQLPRNWMVRGYAPPNTVGYNWYEAVGGDPGRYQPGEAAWVFPETSFFDHNQPNDGARRNTFMLRFAGGTGALTGMSMSPALVVLPAPTSKWRSGNAATLWQRPDRADDLVGWTRRVLTDPLLSALQRWQIIGRGSSDMVMALPVQAMALYDETKLAQSMGVRVDRVSGSLLYVRPQDYNNNRQLTPQWTPDVTGNPLYSGYNAARVIGRWVEGFDIRTGAAPGDRAETVAAKLYSVARYSGGLRAVVTPRPEEVNP